MLRGDQHKGRKEDERHHAEPDLFELLAHCELALVENALDHADDSEPVEALGHHVRHVDILVVCVGIPVEKDREDGREIDN